MGKKCSIICPFFKAEEYITPLFCSLKKQKDIEIIEYIFILTDTGGKEKDTLDKMARENSKVKYSVIKPKYFSHSLVREKAAFDAKGDILVFVTQDVEIRDSDWLKNLASPIVNGEVDACYSRQKTRYNNIEKYTREFNYPSRSFVISKDDIKEKGLKTFFFSDAAGAISKSKFVELGGYDGKNLPISEDMYYAYKLIINGGKIKYCADSVVYHSHKFSLKQIYGRYKLTGKFFKENNYLDQYGTTASGSKMAKYVFKRIMQEKRVLLFFRFPFDMGARWLGMKVGKR